MFFFLIYSCKHEQTHKQTCKHCTHPNPPSMFFFFTATPAVEGANPGQLKSSILLTRRASKFGGKTRLLTRCFVLCQAPLSKVCVFFLIPSFLYPLSKGWLHLFGSQFFSMTFLPFEQGLLLYLPLLLSLVFIQDEAVDGICQVSVAKGCPCRLVPLVPPMVLMWCGDGVHPDAFYQGLLQNLCCVIY